MARIEQSATDKIVPYLPMSISPCSNPEPARRS